MYFMVHVVIKHCIVRSAFLKKVTFKCLCCTNNFRTCAIVRDAFVSFQCTILSSVCVMGKVWALSGAKCDILAMGCALLAEWSLWEYMHMMCLLVAHMQIAYKCLTQSILMLPVKAPNVLCNWDSMLAYEPWHPSFRHVVITFNVWYYSKCPPLSPSLTYCLWIYDIKLTCQTLWTLVCCILKSVIFCASTMAKCMWSADADEVSF